MVSGPVIISAEPALPFTSWLEGELRAYEVPETLPLREWVPQHVRIPGGDAAIPGKVNLDLTPYLREIYDAIDDPAVEEITILAATQIGKTTFLYSIMLGLTRLRPGPLLLVMPVEPDAREIAGGILRDYVKSCDPVMELAIGGEDSLTKEGFEFGTCRWYFGWSNSARSMGRRPCRYVLFDEVGDYPSYVGNKADPIRLGNGRLRTFRHTLGVKSIVVTSPTVPSSLEGKRWDSSDQRSYWVPCPLCGRRQVMTRHNIGWPHDEKTKHSIDPDEILARGLAWYTCAHCGGRWSDAHRLAAVRCGLWAPAGQHVNDHGQLAGTPAKPYCRHRGFRVPSWLSAFETLPNLAYGWLTSQHDLTALQDYVQQQCAEFWQDSAAELKEDLIRKHEDKYSLPASADGGWVACAPPGVQVVVTTIDVQRGYYVVETRGWGYGLESWLLDARMVLTEPELHDYLLTFRAARVDEDGKPIAGDERPPLSIRLGLIDSGDQTAMVYDLCQSWGDVDLRPTKGEDEIRGASKVTATPIVKNPRTRRSYGRPIMLYVYDSGFFKDAQARLASVEQPGAGYFHLPAGMPEVWYRQFLSESKVPKRHRATRGRSGRVTFVWEPRSEHTPNHYWDTAVMQCVATDGALLNLRQLPDPNHPVAPPRRRMGRLRGYKDE